MAKGAASIELTKQSQANFDSQMRKLERRMDMSVDKGLIKFMQNVKNRAQSRLKARGHNDTTRLVNSISVQDKRGSDNERLNVTLQDHEFAVGTNVEYAAAVELGSRPHIIRAKNAKTLGTPDTGYFGKEVHHPGYGGDSYLYWAARTASIDDTVQAIKKELKIK